MAERFGMHDPDTIDLPGKPFSYFANPNDLLGAFGAPVGSEVTPEGYVYTGLGELMFFIGNPLEAVRARIRTLHRGCLPIIEYDLERNGVRFAFQMFAADLGGELKGLPVNFVRVSITNTLSEPRAAFFSTAWRFQAECNTLDAESPYGQMWSNVADYRFRQTFENMPADLVAGQDRFNPEWQYQFAKDALIRDDRLVYSYPVAPEPIQKSLAILDSGLQVYRFFSGEIQGDLDHVSRCKPHTPLGVVTYCLDLAPGETDHLVYKLPIVPLPVGSGRAAQLSESSYEDWLDQTISFWDDMVLKRVPLSFPERKVQEYLVGNTIVNLLSIDQIGEDTIVNVNKFHYHDWYGGSDTTHMLRAMEYMGLLDVARQGFLFWRKMQFPDGSFRMKRHPDALYWELFGWTLWGWADHYRMTRDRGFLESVYPGVVAATDWHDRVTSEDPLGLWPSSTISDDAYLKNCRQTGQHLWALAGLQIAIFMAREMGRSDDAERFESQRQRFRDAFELALAAQTAQTGGYIPPALDRTTAGNDWDNLLTLYPRVLFDPEDPRVETTLRTVRDQYQEGILQYFWPHAVAREGDSFVFNEEPLMHYWQTPNNAQASLVRGTAWDQEWAVKELYALLLHTSSTHLPGEFGTVAWSTRECSHCFNILPQGATSSKTIELLRNMLIREQDEDLYLLSAVSPKWIKPRQMIEMASEPSAFGPINMRVASEETKLSITLPTEFRNAPNRMFLRVPWFYDVKHAELDGQPIMPSEGHFLLPTEARDLIVHGEIRPDAPDLSYEQAVADYKSEYRQRYQSFLQTGSRHIAP